MQHSRASRSVAVFVATLFAFQLSLTGSGMACMMPGPTGQGTTRTMSGAMTMGSSHAAAERPAASSDADGMPEHLPCGDQMNLALCQAMGPCITALAALVVAGSSGRLDTSSRMIAMAVLTPPSRSFPPEPPPPRA